MRSRYLTQQKDIDEIIGRCQVCYVGMIDTHHMPYVVPFNFGYKDGIIYLHSAKSGWKMDALENNPQVCVVFSTDHLLRAQSEQVACSYSMHYRSVQAFGKVCFVEDPEEKVKVLNIIMSNYTDREFTYNAPSIREVAVYYIKVERFSGKIFGYVK